ncbi:MAG: septum formation protein Maf [Bdellovibrio sp.]|nr:MAG: septum formation protein Maf [Bdellovibrio sp.]
MTRSVLSICAPFIPVATSPPTLASLFHFTLSLHPCENVAVGAQLVLNGGVKSSPPSFELVLASASPRRRQLLSEAGFKFIVHPSKISETLEENLIIEDQILDLAGRKARAAMAELLPLRSNPFLVVAADTMVVHKGLPFGKPQDEQEAFLILRRLSGAIHRVYTALSVMDSVSQSETTHLEATDVEFRPLTDNEIYEYIATGEPMDKAGAYGMQGAGGKFVARYSGSYSNIVGLPMEAFLSVLKEQGWRIR